MTDKYNDIQQEVEGEGFAPPCHFCKKEASNYNFDTDLCWCDNPTCEKAAKRHKLKG